MGPEAGADAAVGWHGQHLFDPGFGWGAEHRRALDESGFVVLPALLTPTAQRRLLAALARVDALNTADATPRQQRLAALEERLQGAVDEAEIEELGWDLWEEQRLGVRRVAAEWDPFIEATIAHPQMLQLAADAVGSDVCFDHCALNIRHAGNPGQLWHTHGSSDLQGFV